MPPPEPSRVFISYAHRDGAELAQRLQADLRANGLDAWLDKQRLAGGSVWSTVIEQEIDGRQVTVALLTRGSYESEICRAEQLRSLDKGKRVIPVLATKGADRPLHLYARHYRDFTDTDTYNASLRELIADIRGDATAILPEEYRKTRVTYITAPPRVVNYRERPEALRALRDTLFAEDHRQPIALTALAGMGGIGKTVLAKALTDDEVVRRAFPDGIVWIMAGRETRRDFTEQMREVAKALGDDLSRYENAQACVHQYRTTIADKAALIVVDDVWSKADIEPLLAESPRSRFLFTTRDAAIGRFVGAREHSVSLLDVVQSRELLASWAAMEVGQLPTEADALIAECGRLPLALSLVGAMLRDATPAFWRDTLALLRKADLSAIQEQLPEGQESFFRAVQVSFQALEPHMQERYQALAVLPEDMEAPLSILETLWNASEAEARHTGRHFVDRSLAQRNGVDESIRLHDLQLDYVRAQYPDQDALNLILGAVRLSSHVICRDPGQFTSQLVGRLLPYQNISTIKRFLAKLVEGTRTRWLRLLQPTLNPPGTSLIRTMEGHSGFVVDITLSGDGRLAISVSEDGTLKVWDVESGRDMRTVQGHPTFDEYMSYKGAAALSGDGRLAISASSDKTVRVWAVESGCELCTLEGHSDYVWGVALSTDGRLAVSASVDDTLKVWDVASGRELRTLRGHSSFVADVAISRDGRVAVSASWDHTLKVWDVESGCELHTLRGHSDCVDGVALSGDGRVAISASWDHTLKVWDVESGCELRTLEGHSGHVWGMAISRDGRVAVSASPDGTLKIWDVESGRELRNLKGTSKVIHSVAMSADGRRVVSASADHTLKVWDVNCGSEVRMLESHSARVSGVAVSGDGRHAVSASADHTLKLWDVESGRVLRTLRGHTGEVWGVAMSGDGRWALSASDQHDNTLRLWNLETGCELRTLKDSAAGGEVAMSGDGRWAVSASWDHVLKVWDLRTGRKRRALKGYQPMAVTPDGGLAVSVAAYVFSDTTLKVWDVKSGRELRTLKGHTAYVRGMAVSGDGRVAVSAAGDGSDRKAGELKVWDVKGGRELRTLSTGHADLVNAVAMTRDGRRAVSASRDKTLKVWDVESGVLLATFSCAAQVECCAFINDCKLIAGDDLGQVHFLELVEPSSTCRAEARPILPYQHGHARQSEEKT